MNYLAIDTSGRNLTVIARVNGKTYTYFDKECGVNHSVLLMPQLEKLLLENGLKLKDMDFLAVCLGPGSFTGIRIGVSTIKALCFSLSLPCLAVTSFDCLAYNKQNGKVLSVIDAGHDNFYVCGYDGLKVVLQPRFIELESLKELQSQYLIVSQNPIEGVTSTQVDICQGFNLAIEGNLEKITTDLDKVCPLYVKKSQAEEQNEKK